MAHWNEKDPVADENYPNIQEYVPSIDDPQWPDDDGQYSCMTKKMEEVNPDG